MKRLTFLQVLRESNLILNLVPDLVGLQVRRPILQYIHDSRMVPRKSHITTREHLTHNVAIVPYRYIRFRLLIPISHNNRIPAIRNAG